MTKKEPHKVALKIEGTRITADKFARGVAAFLGILDDVANEVAASKNAITWVITVESGSAMLLAQPEVKKTANAEFIPPVLHAIQGGAESLENSAEAPPHFSESSLEKMRDLASLRDKKDRGISSVKLIVDNVPIEISENTTFHVDEIIQVHQIKALGSIQGELEMMTRRGGYKCAVYDELTDRRIECYFNRKMKESIRLAWDSRVSVYGIITYDKTGQPTSIKVQEFRQLEAESNLPSFEDMKGIFKE